MNKDPKRQQTFPIHIANNAIAFVGIDPGLKGGVVVMRGGLIECHVTPTLKGKGSKKVYNEKAMADIIADIAAPCVFYLERQQAMPFINKKTGEKEQGSTSTFSTGYGYGLWRGILAGLRVPCVVVHPKTWQKKVHAGFPIGDTKARTLQAVQARFPDAGIPVGPRSGKPHEGIVDALGIAWFGAMAEGGA